MCVPCTVYHGTRHAMHILAVLSHTTFKFRSVRWHTAHMQVHVVSKQWYGDFSATVYASKDTAFTQITVHDSSLCVAVHCPAGTFAGEKQQQCTHCPRGFYQNRDRQGSCIRCTMGTYTREEGMGSYAVLSAPVILLFVTKQTSI